MQELHVETAAISFPAVTEEQGHCALKPRFNLQFCMRMIIYHNIYKRWQRRKWLVMTFLVVSKTGVC